MAKKGGLGKGLGLIFEENTEDNSSGTVLDINEIEPNREQPRKEFDPQALSELAQSIMTHGLIQPILVRPIFTGGYQIVAGERRWRAARMAGLKEVPVLIREMDDKEYLQLSLIENLQREDLNPIEEAKGYESLINSYGFTQEDVSKSVGKSRPAVTNALRLLALPEEVLEMLLKGEISAGHARTLLGFGEKEEMIKAALLVKEKNLSVRQLEAMLKQKNSVKKEKVKNTYFSEAELALNSHLGRKVVVGGSQKKGTLQIEFYGEDDLKELLSQLNLSE